MKTLKENTIIPKGVCFGECITVFSMRDASDMDRSNFVSLAKMVNRRIFVDYMFDEDGTEKTGKIRVTVPDTNDEGIKAFVITEINKELNK